MLDELLIILILTLLNGFFSMSEIALVTVRKTRIAELIKLGNTSAIRIQTLQKRPENLFATVQIGMSVITIAASVFAGASIAEDLANVLARVNFSFVQENAYALSFALVVIFVSYINITLGELIPKSLGLRYAERMALLAASPIYFLSKISQWLIKPLSFTSNLVLKIFKDSTSFTEGRLSEEEIRSLISEGRDAGTVEPHEHTIIQNVFNFSDLSVDKIMVPRTQMTAVDIDMPAEEIVHRSIESGYSRIPVYKESINNIVGILYTKQLLPVLERKKDNLNIKEMLVDAYFIPSTMKISQVLQRLQKKKIHVALVTDEHGEIDGLVTLEDILEEIVGDISDETDEPNTGIRNKGENYIVAGNVSVVDFNRYFNTDIPEDQDFNTMSGFILQELGRFPKEGNVIVYKDLEFKVKEATERVVKSVIVRELPE